MKTRNREVSRREGKNQTGYEVRNSMIHPRSCRMRKPNLIKEWMKHGIEEKVTMKGGDSLFNLLWDLAESLKTFLHDLDAFETIRELRTKTLPHYRTTALLRGIGIDKNLIYSKVSEMQSFSATVAELEIRFHISHDDAQECVRAFAFNLCEHLESSFTSRILGERIGQFINELKGDPIRYDIHVSLDGVVVHPDTSFEFSDGTRLKPYSGKWELFDSELYLEVVGHSDDANEKLTQVLYILQLYRLASVWPCEGAIVPISFFEKTKFINPPHIDGQFYYEITQSNKEDLRSFYEEIQPLLKEIFQQDKFQFIRVSLDRYEEALTRPRKWEQRISYAISSLEALLLKPKERDGLSRRLGQRLAVLLSLFEYDPSQVYDSVINAYDVRSTYVHGGEAEDDDTLHPLCVQILEMARGCLVSLIQLLNHDKNKIIMLLDNAMINPKFRKKVEDLVANVSLRREQYDVC
jgi:hypothetical protein